MGNERFEKDSRRNKQKQNVIRKTGYFRLAEI